MKAKIPFIFFSVILILSAGNSQAEDYLVWGKTTGYNTGTTGSGTSYNCSSNAGGFGTVSRDLWKVNSSTGGATNVASFDTNSCSGLTESGTSFETGSYVDKNSGNFYALQSDKTFKIFSGTDGSLLGTTTAPSLTNVTLDGLSHTGTATIVDTSGKKVLEKKSDGSIHFGENSFITREYGGHQEIYATNAAGSAIDLNVTNGSDLLVNGTSVMGSIRGLADGVRGTTAMSAALSSVPAMSGDREFECGVGVGSYSSKQALAMSCGARFDDQITANFGASFLPGGSQSYLLGEMDAVVLRAGISFKFGKSYASSSANKMSALNDDTFNSYQLSEAQREVDGLRNKVASLESSKVSEVAEMKSLKAEVAEMKLMMAGLLGNRVVAMR
jgi:hypothetical protein